MGATRLPRVPISSATDDDGKWAKRPALKSPVKGGPAPPDAIHWLDRRKGGFHGASCDDGYVHTVWAEKRGAVLVGSPLPEDVIALDFDRSEDEWLTANPDVADIYQAQRAATFVVESRPGRHHVYFRVPSGLHIPASFPGHGPRPADNIRAYGEIKGAWTSSGTKAGYVVVAGQTRPDGKGSYRVVHGDPTDLVLMDPRLVDHLLDGTCAAVSQTPTGPSVSLRPSTFTQAGEDWRMEQNVGEGGREPALHSLAWSRPWRSAEDLRVSLAGYNALHCTPPHAQSYVDEIAAREWLTYEAREKKGVTPDNTFSTPPADEAPSAPQTDVEPDPAPAPPPAPEMAAAPDAARAPQTDAPTGKIIIADSAEGLGQTLDHLRISVRWSKRSARHEIQPQGRAWEGLTARGSEILAERVSEAAVKLVHDRPEPWRVTPQRWRQLLHRLTADNAVDPFALWLDTLPAWDQQARLRHVIDRVMAPVNASDRLWHWCCTAPFVAAVQRTQTPGARYQHITFYCGVRPNTMEKLWEALLPSHHDVGHVDLGSVAKDQHRACVGPVIVALTGFAARGAGRALRRLVIARDDAFWEGGSRVECPRRCVLVAAVDEHTAIPAECRADDLAIPAQVRPLDEQATADGLSWVALHRRQLWAEAVWLAAAWQSLEPPSDVVAEAEAVVGERAYCEDNSEELALEWALANPTGLHRLHHIAKLANIPHDSEKRLPKNVLDGTARGIKRAGWRRVNRRDAHGVQRLLWAGPEGEEAHGVRLTGGADTAARRSARSASTAHRVVDIDTGRPRA